jgi:hypothetical protein
MAAGAGRPGGKILPPGYTYQLMSRGRFGRVLFTRAEV